MTSLARNGRRRIESVLIVGMRFASSPAVASVVGVAVATRHERGDSIVWRHHPVGASTGYMNELRGDWPGLVAKARGVSPAAVELSALSETELRSLCEYLAARPSLPFRYVSVHGPSKDRRLPEEDLVAALRELAAYADAVVMHPDAIHEAQPYRALGRKLVLENMDGRKDWGRTREEIEMVFARLPEAGFCFDVAHAWSMAPDMSIADDLLDGFGDRLRHLHVSSLSPELHHMPLTREHEELFRPVLQRCLDVPWILEAPPRAA